MPFVFDSSATEDLPRLSAFSYVPSTAIDGPPPPVRFSLDRHQPPPPVPAAKPSLLGRLFGWKRAPEEPKLANGPSDYLQLILPKLQALKIAKAYCHYDGGHDEGFAWLDYVETRGGERIELNSLVELLESDGIAQVVHAHYKAGQSPNIEVADIPPKELLHEVVRDELACFGAELLLGERYGTGEYWMYGAFIMDFETGVITDDPKAEPVLDNIANEIGKD